MFTIWLYYSNQKHIGAILLSGFKKKKKINKIHGQKKTCNAGESMSTNVKHFKIISIQFSYSLNCWDFNYLSELDFIQNKL